MSRRKRKSVKGNNRTAALIVAAIATLLTLFYLSGKYRAPLNKISSAISSFSSSAVAKQNAAAAAGSPSAVIASGGSLTVSFIDVGQGGSIPIDFFKIN